MNYKKKLTPEFKAKVALEAIQETMTVSEIARKYEISPSAVTKFKEELFANASQVFEPKGRVLSVVAFPYQSSRFIKILPSSGFAPNLPMRYEL